MNKQEMWLAIDTSTATMAGAITSGERLLASVQTESERNHSIHIMTNIEVMLHSSGVQLHELDGIVTGIGPGSYTGVRIAVTAAKTLAWTCDKPLIGVSSLAALAVSGIMTETDEQIYVHAAERSVEQTSKQTLEQSSVKMHTLVLPLIDARRGQVYTAAFVFQAKQEQQGVRLHHDHIVLMEQWCQHWISSLAQLQAEGIVRISLFGDVDLHETSIVNLRQAAAQYGIEVIAAPHTVIGKAIAQLGQGKWLEERITVDEQHELVPNYAQLTEAEVKQNAKEREEGKA